MYKSTHKNIFSYYNTVYINHWNSLLMYIQNRDQLKLFIKNSREDFSLWIGFNIKPKYFREFFASLTLSNSYAHLCARLNDGPVELASHISETNFEQRFSDLYKIKVPEEAKVEINEFLNSDVLDVIQPQ
jgi:hypothetical protein